MSSTTNVQNLLVNVFRPVYTYDATATTFTPRLEVSNIDNYSGNTISVFTAAVGDINNNVYVGSNAGNPYTTTKLCRNVTALGYAAGSNISNVSNTTYVGFNAGAGALSASNVVAIGANTNGNGISNVYVGTGAGGGGNSNVFVGSGTTGSGSGSILIGPGLSDGATNAVFKLGQSYLTGNMTTKWLGIGTPTPYDSNNRLDVSGNLYVLGQQGINMVPIRTLDVNGDFRSSDAFGTLNFNLGNLTVSNSSGTLTFADGVTTSSGGVASGRGTISNASVNSTTTIGTLKHGAILVSAKDRSTSVHYESTMVFCPSDTNGSLVVGMTSNAQGGEITILFPNASSNIQISNSTTVRDIVWSITYFPLP